MKRVANESYQRFRGFLKRNPNDVAAVGLTLAAYLFAAGYDADGNDMMSVFYVDRPNPLLVEQFDVFAAQERDGARRTLVEFLTTRERALRANTIFDLGLTWLFNSMRKIVNVIESDPGSRESQVARELADALLRRYGSISRWVDEARVRDAQNRAVRIELNRYTPEQALARAAAWAERRRQTTEAILQGVVVYRFDDGYTIQLLSPKNVLVQEGRVMDHCIGSYWNNFVRAREAHFSVRDEYGMPQATFTMYGDGGYEHYTVNQVQGPSNDEPEPEHLVRIAKFLQDYDIAEQDLLPIPKAEMGFWRFPNEEDRVPGNRKMDYIYFAGPVEAPPSEIVGETMVLLVYKTGGRYDEKTWFAYESLSDFQDAYDQEIQDLEEFNIGSWPPSEEQLIEEGMDPDDAQREWERQWDNFHEEIESLYWKGFEDRIREPSRTPRGARRTTPFSEMFADAPPDGLLPEMLRANVIESDEDLAAQFCGDNDGLNCRLLAAVYNAPRRTKRVVHRDLHSDAEYVEAFSSPAADGAEWLLIERESAMEPWQVAVDLRGHRLEDDLIDTIDRVREELDGDDE